MRLTPFLMAGLLGLSGCSVSLDQEHSNLSLVISGPERNRTELFPGLRLVGDPPTDSSQFDCLLVNVVGPGIAPLTGYTPTAAEFNQAFQNLLNGGHCTYPAISAIAPNTPNTETKLTLRVPTGPKRVVQVAGVVDDPVEPVCGKPRLDFDALQSAAHHYEIGRIIVDLFKDSAVNVFENYNGLPAAEQTARRMNCPNPGAAAYQSLILSDPTLVAYWPMLETAGTVLTDARAGMGNLTLSGVTFNRPGPPSMGQPAIRAGAGNITGGIGHDFANTSFAVEFWVNYTGACLNSGAGAFFVIRHLGPALIRFRCNASNFVVFEVEDNSNQVATVVSTIAVNDGNWHHIVGNKLSASSIELHVDGVATNMGAGFIGNFNFSTSPLTQIGQDSVFGTAQTADYAAVAVYDQALTAAMVTTHKDAGLGGSAALSFRPQAR